MSSLSSTRCVTRFPRIQTKSSPLSRRVRELPEIHLIREFCSLVVKHCYRKGAGSAAQAFATRLEEQLKERFPQLFSALNLEAHAKAKAKNETETLMMSGCGTDNEENRNVFIGFGTKEIHPGEISSRAMKFLPSHLRE